MLCITMIRLKMSSVLFILITLFGIAGDLSAEIDHVPLEFGFHNMLSNWHDYYDVFYTCLEKGITVHSVEFEWREDRIPGHYYWGRSDSIVVAAHDAMTATGISIELRCRFDVDICSPLWAPFPEKIWADPFWIVRISEYEYYSEMLAYLELFLERYRPGGILAQEYGWGSDWGITSFDIFGEMDRTWYAVNDDGYPLHPDDMPLFELAQLYSEYRDALQLIEPSASIAFSTSSTPFGENEDDFPRLQSEAQYVAFVNNIRFYLEIILGKAPLDEFDWHTFILWNDPLNPGIYSPPPNSNWAEKSFHARAGLIESLFRDVETDISTLEGASTCYWTYIRSSGVEMSHRNHIIFQLSCLTEISYKGKTRVLVFDSTIDDDVTSDLGEYYTQFEEWWDSSLQPEDYVLDVYGRMTSLLTGHYCIDRIENNVGLNTMIRFVYYDPVSGTRTHLIRARFDTQTTEDYVFPVMTDEVLVYRMLQEPYLLNCTANVCSLPPGLDWDIIWLKEVEEITDSDNRLCFRVLGANPCQESITFQLSSDFENVENVLVFDITGRCLSTVPVEHSGEMSSAVMMIGIGGIDLPSGTYFVSPEGHIGMVRRFTVLR